MSVLIRIGLICSLMLLQACGDKPNDPDVLEKEKLAEQQWPKWHKFENAVPKPKWWDSVGIYYLDPLNASDEEWRQYVEKNDGPDRFKRSFKVAYARVLQHPNDAEKIAGLIYHGTTTVYKPLYEFYIAEYMDATWQNAYCKQCNDANMTIRIGADLVSMKLDVGQVDASLAILEQLMDKKYQRANVQTRYSLLLNYRRALEHIHGVEYTRKKLATFVEENIKLAEASGNQTLMSRWLGVLDHPLRRINK